MMLRNMVNYIQPLVNKVTDPVLDILSDGWHWLSRRLKPLRVGVERLRSRRPVSIGMAMVLVSGMIPIASFVGVTPAQGAWFNEDWQYRKSQLLTHASAEDNVYVDFSGANALDTSASGKFQADCGDLRFIDAAGNELPYYLVSGCGTTTTVVHVLFSALPAGEQYIYIYYGNPSVGNGTTGFDFSTAATGVTFGIRGTEESTKGPVAEWKLNEGYGTTTKNSNSGQYTGTLTSGPTWQPQENCVSGKCLRFDGVDDNVTISNATPLQITGDITIEAWVFPINNTLYQPIVSKDSSNEYEIAADFRSGADLATRWEGAQKNFSGFFNGYTNRWVHVAVTISGSTIAAYRNGALVGTTTGVSRTISTNNVTIGKRTGGSFWFKGLIDEVKIYDYAITLSQLQWQYVADSQQLVKQGGNLQNGLVGYWKMDEASWSGVAGEMKDSSLSGRDLTAYNGVTVTAGEYGNGAITATSGRYIGGTDTTILAENAARGYSFWIKPNSSGNWMSVWSLYITNNLGNIMYQTGSAINARICENNSTLSVVPIIGQWNHVVFTFDPVSMTEVSYLNGAKKQSIDISDTGCAGFPDARSMLIGGYSLGGNPVDGSLDEFREYSRTLSQQDVQQLYNFAPRPEIQYDFEGTGSTVHDVSGHGYDGGINGGSEYRTEGKYGRGLNIEPSETYTSTSKQFTPLNQITISAWIKPDSLSNNIAGTTRSYFSLNSNGSLWFRIYDSSENYHTVNSPNDTLTTADLGKWWFVTATYDGATVRIYLNGTLVKDSSLSIATTVTAASFHTGYVTSGYFDGDIDEVKVYNYARTSSQIVEDMRGGQSVHASPVAWYKMDEGSGTTVKNSGLAGDVLDGTLVGNAYASGKYGQALNFDNDDYVTLPATSTLPIYNKVQTTGFSLSAWVKGDPQTNRYLYGEGSTSVDTQAFIIAPGDTGKLVIYLRDNAGSYQILNESSSTTVFDGTWHHITWIDNNGEAKLYVDGQLDSHDFSYTAGTAHSFNTSTIGGIQRTTVSNSRFDGQIDEFKIYDKVLTQQEIVADYNRLGTVNIGPSGSETVTTGSGGAGTIPSNSKDSQYCVPGDTSPCAPPVGEWKFEEGSGTVVKDTSGGGNDGTMNDGVGWGIGKYGGAGNFDGVDDFVDMGNSSILSPSNITVSAWIKPTATDGSRYIVAKNAGSSSTKDYTLMISGGVARFSIFNGNAGYGVSGTTTISPNQWHHLTGSWDGVTVKIYLDGLLEGTLVPGVSKSSTSQRLMIGKTDSWGGPFAGQIDNVRLYDYARNTSQIAWDFNQGKPIAWYKMNECQGNKLHSSTEPYNSALDGTINLGASGQTTIGSCLSSGTAWGDGANGKSGGSLAFDGTDDYTPVPQPQISSSPNLFTFATWIKPGTQSGVVVGPHSNGYDNYIIFDNTNQRIGVQVCQSSDTNVRNRYSANGSVSNSQWTHIAVSINDKQINIYINGRLTNTFDESIDIANWTGAWELGRRGNGAGGGNYFSGQIDDVQIFNYALTPKQIASVYNGGSVKWGASN